MKHKNNNYSFRFIKGIITLVLEKKMKGEKHE